jgi:hypothetical protein
MNLDTQAIPTAGTALAFNAAGVATVAPGLQVTLSDPSGIVVPGTVFLRGFNGNYYYGIDWWPMLTRAAGNPAFSIPPPGAQGTDWDINDSATAYGGHATYTGITDRGTLLCGLGIKTSTGLGSGSRYSVSFPLALGKMRIFPSAPTSGVLSLDVGGTKKDYNGAGVMRPSGMRITTWARLITSGTLASTAPVRYLMSVTGDGVVLVVNEISGGRIGTAHYCAYEPTDPQYDVFPMAFNANATDYPSDPTGANYFWSAHQFPYWPLRRRQDGTAEAVRDWQTGFMRCEHAYYHGSYNYSGSTVSDVSSQSIPGSATVAPSLIPLGMASYTGGDDTMCAPMRQPKPGPDGRWWMYPIRLAEGDWNQSVAGSSVDESRIMRGVMPRFRFVPDDAWASWDEITGTSDGRRWLLLKPDHMGTGARIRTSANVFYGGVAIEEV